MTVLLLYTLIAILAPRWSSCAEELDGSGSGGEPSFYADVVIGGLGGGLGGLGHSGLDGVGIGGAQVDRTISTHSKRSTFTREEQNSVVRAQNIDWGDNWVHHLSAARIFGDQEDDDDNEQRRRGELRKRWDDDYEGDYGAGLESRQTVRNRTVYITFNTCLQPVSNTTDDHASSQPPQLQVYVSNSTSNKAPGPKVDDNVQYVLPVDMGFGRLDIVATGDIWVGVYAESRPSSQKTAWLENPPWNYEISLSTEEPYHGFSEDQFLYLVDTDDSTALLITGNMTEHSSKSGGVDETAADLADSLYHPYTMYAENRATTSRFVGLEKSYCAVRQLARIRPANSAVSRTTRGLGNFSKQQFHLRELNRSSEYAGYLARPRNKTTSDTSGILWRPVSLKTKTDGNCEIIYDLPFCSEVAYAVPSNPTVFGNIALKDFYDDLSAKWWKNFTYSLQQIQCNASNSAAYSLVRNCDDCSAAYKNWLCAVTIPRCMDHSSNLPYLAERSSNKLFWNNTDSAWQQHPFMPKLAQDEIDEWTSSGGWLKNGNQSMSRVPSRNTKIDEIVKPGAYKEVRPCKDLCWTLVQSCPSQLGFTCPRDFTWGKEMSYGERDDAGDITCSYLGAVYFLSAASRHVVGVWWLGVLAGSLALWASM
ncbi:stretch-activated Ca2+-permeable channel component-domain-containing protein [Tricharina praecox]|uniref:stretch-activated Ca2+-permeable channel component-domain-containing protein n=1 Tax=Tricharina praecox TaxID=43433 RepID=UPI00221EBFDE|nr:stretch-activated Ca2+-permeable channel component-domain-containing protein [Tricharina praecox]KAI5854702.1 stretch-activated Ca2+-permeable channel component-domain-containing protein [Tricharina praecox]